MPTVKAQRTTHEIDAADQSVGRLATRIATLLRGKNKPTYEPHLDQGDTVVVSNITKLKFTGQKLNQKVYHHYSGYPGGMKTEKLSKLVETKPEEVLWRAVYQMLPPTRLRKDMMKRLVITK
jgi:large subunit ribosomal protein L13